MSAPRPPLNKLAIVIGISVDVVGLMVVVVGFFIVLVAMVGGEEARLDETLNAWMRNPGFLIAESVISALAAMLGGYLSIPRRAVTTA